MDIPSPFQSKDKETLAIVFDIGSASIGGSLVLLSHTKPPKILYTVRHEMAARAQMQIERLVSLMGDTLKSVIADIQKNGFKHLTFTNLGESYPRAAYCVFSSPWHASQVRKIVLEKKDSFSITPQLLEDLIEKEVEAARAGDDQGAVLANSVLIEKEATNIKINGYEVSHLQELEAEKLEALLYLSFVPQEVMTLVSEQVENAFSLDEVVFHSFTLSFFSTMRDIRNTEENAVLVDINGETTEISLMKDGALFESTSFPLGKNTYIRTLAQELAMSPQEALSAITMYFAGTIDDVMEKQVEHLVDMLESKWKITFQETLLNLSEGVFLPHQVFLTAGKPFLQRFTEIIKHQDVHQFIHRQESFMVEALNSKRFSDLVQFNGSARRDPFLVIDTLFINDINKADLVAV